MTLARKIANILEGELNQENIKTVIDMVDFLKLKENQAKWDKINASEHEYLSNKERNYLDEIKLTGDFIDQDHLLQELGISRDKI